MRRLKRGKKLTAGRVALLTITLAAVAAFGGYVKEYSPVQNLTGIFAKDYLQEDPVKNERIKENKYLYITKEHADLGSGSLILVNNGIPYKQPRGPAVINTPGRNHSSAALDASAVPCFDKMLADLERARGIRNIYIVSGYRTLADQERILNEKIKLLGQTKAAELAARPGYSEHHTGYAIDIGIFNNSGKGVSYTGQGRYSWINEYCGNYGFILRYRGDKTGLTGIADEPWHYRYVAQPHANIIKQHDFCLEEYIDYLRSYPFESKHLEFVDFDGTGYEIYFVRALSDRTPVPVPQNREYSVSGNNVDGFIVTVKNGAGH